MRFLSMPLCVVLGAGILFTGGVSSALADSEEATAACPGADAPLPVAAQPGTHEEARAYEQREEQSPEVQEFAGGDVYVGVSLGFILLVLIIVLLLRD
ncbi:MAG: hypothetical protein L0323_15060 [Planctomycetes bacterium]|nr:hypothetical protein [Planctomycetota bacterium]